jgi:hypothetical protein
MRWIGSAAPAAHWCIPLRRASLALAFAAAWSGCLVGDEKCSANQRYDEMTHLCTCAAGAVPDPKGYGCTACGEHEAVVAGACQCSPGYTRPAAGMPCEEATGGVAGAPCSAETPCAEPFPYCATFEGESFCSSQGCTANGDCPATWICDTSGSSSFCRQPQGFGEACTSSSDCGGEATYCETFVAMICIVEKCAADPSVCPSGDVCCDATGFLGTSLCTPTSALMNGMCFDGNPPVSP